MGHPAWAVATLALEGLLHAFDLVVIALGMAIVATTRRRRALAFTVAAAVGTLTAWVAADANLYGLMGLHLDRQTIDHLFQPQALTTLGLEWRDFGELGGNALLGTLIGLFTGRALERAIAATPRSAWVGLCTGLGLLGEGSLGLGNALIHFNGIAPLVGLTDAMPLAWSPHLDGFLSHWTGHQPQAVDDDVQFPSFESPPAVGRTLRPMAPPSSAARTPDVVIIAVESLRSDAFQSMPKLQELAHDSWVFPAHHSAGVCTHTALFSLLTGLAPSYWAAAGTATSPVGLNAFSALGYRLQFKESMGLNNGLVGKALPEGDRDIVPTPPTDPRSRDIENAAWLRDWVAKPHAQPSLAIVFLDSTHWPYSVEGTDGLLPSTFNSWTERAEVDSLRRRYQRAVAEADQRIGEVVDELKAVGRFESTVIIVVGDHGEAFREHGVLMHCSRLDEEQLRVPLVIHFPNVAPRTVDEISVHQDILPTVLGYMEAHPTSGPGFGIDLFHPERRPRSLLVASYGTVFPVGYGLLSPGRKILFELGAAAPSLVGVLNGEDISVESSPGDYPGELARAYEESTALLQPAPGARP